MKKKKRKIKFKLKLNLRIYNNKLKKLIWKIAGKAIEFNIWMN
jgi:hypothetical protein